MHRFKKEIESLYLRNNYKILWIGRPRLNGHIYRELFSERGANRKFAKRLLPLSFEMRLEAVERPQPRRVVQPEFPSCAGANETLVELRKRAGCSDAHRLNWACTHSSASAENSAHQNRPRPHRDVYDGQKGLHCYDLKNEAISKTPDA